MSKSIANVFLNKLLERSLSGRNLFFVSYIGYCIGSGSSSAALNRSLNGSGSITGEALNRSSKSSK